MSDLINDHGFLLRKNEYEETLILRSEDFIGGKLKNEIIEYAEKKGIKQIELNDFFGFSLNDLKFLHQFPAIEGIRVIKSGGLDYEELKVATNLTCIINNYTAEPIDFLQFKKLKKADILWDNGRISILQSTSLEEVTFHKFKGKDLKNLEHLKKIRHLILVDSSIETLNSIEGLENLESLELYHNSKLFDLSMLSGCTKLKRLKLGNLSKLYNLDFLLKCKQLENLGIQNCKNIENNTAVFELVNLKILGYMSSGPFKTITPITNLKKIERFFIANTNIIDGDLHPILELKKLISCSFIDKKHYSLKLEDIKSKLNIQQ